MKVILGFGNGNVENGCEHITVEVRGDDEKLIAQDNGSLPGSVQLWELYNSWKLSFRKRFGGRIIISENPGSSSSIRKMELNQCIEQFPREFNQWLNCDGFRAIANKLRHHLNVDTPVSFAVKAEDSQLRYLPWYLWELFEDYPHIEPALAFSKYEAERIGKSQRDNVRILVVIGDSTGIDTEADKEIFQESFGDAVKILDQPSRQKLDTFIRDKQGWDILAFLGHSGSGKIKINETDSLSLAELKNALRFAIQRGLQLAIFNSCDGLGLVRDLRDLYLPHCIVMREPVPDKVAQEFIKNFLPAFKDGKSLSIAVREAREKLQKWENNYPCATWLPVLCQNPAVESINWVHLGGKPACPYRGLFSFREEDAAIFFGREAVSEELYQRVESRQTLIAVVGASGSGKSSVVFAGLIPRLRNTEVEIVDFRPGKNPFESLAVALAPLWYEANHPGYDFEDLQPYERRCQELDLLIGKLQENDRGLCQVVNQIVVASNCRLVLVADQFEELYTLLPQSEEETRKLFLNNLLNAVSYAKSFTLVLTLRADFFNHAIKHCQFAKALKNTNYPLAPMNREELQRAIRIPAEKRGVKFETGLLELLLDDVGEKAENLPLLEFALTQLWTHLEYGLLTRNSYQKIGGLQQSLATHAEDNVYSQLNEEQHKRIKRVFIQLVRPGEGAADTRNVVSKDELLPKDWELITLLNQENARLVVINYDENRRETVEIVHEALINGWGRLSTWMTSHRQFRTWQERLKVAMKNWKEKNNDDGYLLSGGVLGEAEGWLNSEEDREYLSNPQRVFIQLSLDARDRKIREEKKKQRRTIFRLSSALAIALAATGFAGFSWVQAEIRATTSKINNHRINSENLFNLQQYGNALIEGIKGNELLEKTWLKQLIPTGVKQGVEVALHNAIHNSVIEKNTLKEHKSKVIRVKFSPDGKTIAFASDDGIVKFWSADNVQLLDTLEGRKGSVYSVEFSPDGNTIASASRDKTVKLWSVSDKKLLYTLSRKTLWVNSMKFSPDGKTIALASKDQTIKLLSVEDRKVIHTFSGHEDIVWSVEFSPDGKTIASASKDKTVKLWSVEGRKLIHTLKEHEDSVNNVEFSPDGTILASASDDKTVKLWSTKNKNLLYTLEGHKEAVKSVKFSPDGQTIASASHDGPVKLWSAYSKKLLHTLSENSLVINSIRFSPDSKTIVFASYDKKPKFNSKASSDNKVKLWSVENGELIHTLSGHKDIVWSIEFSQDGKTIASASDDGLVKLWSVPDKKLLHTFSESNFYRVEFSQDGKTIASASRDGTLKLRSADNGKLLHTLSGHDVVNSVKFSPDGTILASASDDKTVKLWSTKNKNLLYTLEGHKKAVKSVKFSPDGKTIASASDDNTVKLWSVDNGRLLHTLSGHKYTVYDVVFSQNGNTIVSASYDKIVKLWSTVKLWSADNGELLHTLSGHKYISSDCNTIVSASDDKTVKLWSADNGRLLHILSGHKRAVYDVVFSRNCNTIVSASLDGTIKLWSADNGRLLDTLSEDENVVNSVKFSPDNKTIVSASDDKTVKLWSADNGKLLLTLFGHEDVVNSVKFSPDGKTIVSASDDKTVKLWSVDNGRLLHTLSGHKDTVYNVVFSPDDNGKTIVSASDDKTVKLWNWNFDNLLTRGCNKVKDYLINRPEKLEELKICQNSETLTAAASTLVIQGEELAKTSDFEGAMDKFRKANEWNPELGINPEVKAVTSLVIQGEQLTINGDFEGAVEKFKKAQQLDANVDLNLWTKELENNPKAVAGKFAAHYFVNQGKKLAENGDFEGAVEQLEKAHQLDANNLWIKKSGNKPKVIAGKLAASYYVTQGKKLAENGDFEGAVENLETAQQLDANIDLNPETEELDNNPKAVAGKLAAPYYVTQAKKLAENGDIKGAVEKFKKAQKLDANVDLNSETRELDNNPKSVAVELRASYFVAQGAELAENNNFEGAVEQFKKAQQLNPNVDLILWTKQLENDPKAAAVKVRVLYFVSQGRRLAKNGDIEGAIENFKKAQQLNPNIDLNLWTKQLDNNPKVVARELAAPYFVTQGIKLLSKTRVKEAITAYNKALKIDPNLQISAADWYMLCWFGSLNNHAKDVMFACEKTVAAVESPNIGFFKGARGLARALTGDYKGAIEDFEVFVKWTTNYKEKSQRQSWISDLRNGKNPFTPEVLEKLRKGE